MNNPRTNMKRKISLSGIKYIDHEGVAHISKDIRSIDDLIDLGNTYEHGRKYNIDLKRIYDIRHSLMKLKNMIGLKGIKETLVNQVLYFLQDFHGDDMLHTIIQGPPGVGKTMLANIIGEIYYKMNIFGNRESDRYKFVVAKRSDLIGEYLGTTAAKTQKVIDKSAGGVLLIDEAYSLGNNEGRDSYSKECIDTLNQNLSENKHNFLCIIAGYKDALDKSFFNYNEGLRRRFPFVYTIETYSSNELTNILYDIFRRDKWVCIRDERINEMFQDKYKEFENMAGDIETLAFVTKIEHSKRVLFLHNTQKKIIKYIDIKNGMRAFLENRKNKKEDTKDRECVLSHMYM